MTDLPLWQARDNDPATSHAALAKGRASRRSDCERLLSQYRRAGARGLTDAEAAERAGLLASGYWKRCSDLRTAGSIAPTGETRLGANGRHLMVCRISEAER